MQFKSLYELFKDSKRWCRDDAMAKDKHGKAVASYDTNAIEWCILGGINKVYGYEDERSIDIIRKLKFLWNGDFIADRNRTLTHEQLLEDIKKVESEAQ